MDSEFNGASARPNGLARLAQLRQEAIRYLENGWTPYRLKAQEKSLPGKKEQNVITTDNLLRLISHDGFNIGVLLGNASNGLVDLDLDWKEARLAGSLLCDGLPSFGRATSKGSHRLAVCSDFKKSVKFCLPPGLKDHRLLGEHALTVLEIRTAGHTMFPPSIHLSGELVEWEHGCEPPSFEWARLRRGAGLAAFLAVCIRLWPGEGTRDDTAMALTGSLLSTGLDVESADKLVMFVAEHAGDEEYEKRGKARQTAEKQERGEPTTGMPALVDLLGLPPECIKVFHDWLQTKRDQSSTSTVTTATASPEGAVILDPRAPRENAREFIKRSFTNGEDRTLVYHRDEYFVLEGGRYRPTELAAIHRKLYEFTDSALVDREGRWSRSVQGKAAS